MQLGARIWMGKEKTAETITQSNLVMEHQSSSQLNAQVIMSNIYKTKEAESFSSKFDKLDNIQEQISEVDTLSGISHTLNDDDDDDAIPTQGGVNEVNRHNKRNTSTDNDAKKIVPKGSAINNTHTNESVVKAIVHAQDAIAKTQKEHFDNILTCLGKN